MTPGEKRELDRISLRVRERVIRFATGGGCFIGASLSCVDLIVALYKQFLNIKPESVRERERDLFLLSKGHDVPALYGVFAELGYLDPRRLARHLETSDHIYWHPNRNVDGVEFHSGSLGHLLSVGIGMALDRRLRKSAARVVVLLGDGELNEGSVWEGVLVAQALRLTNLLLIVDRNAFQANTKTEDLIPLEPLGAKFEAFGCRVRRGDGHDFFFLEEALSAFPYSSTGPSVLIADTVRGKGVPAIEARADRWFCNFTGGEIEALIEELHGNAEATLTSETLTVR